MAGAVGTDEDEGSVVIGRLWYRFKHTPWSAHLLRANDRFQQRLGNQLAGGITYFSVLTLIPVLMLVFSGFGMVLTVMRRDWLVRLEAYVIDVVSRVAGGHQAVRLVEGALDNWRTVGLFALLYGAYSGSGWMGGLRGAVRAQWRPDFDWSPPGRIWIVERFVNLFYFVILISMVLVSFLLTLVGSTVGTWAINRAHLGSSLWASPLLKFGSLLLSVAIGYVLFWFLFEVLPQYEAPRAAMVKGTLAAAVGLTALQALTTEIVARWSKGFATIVFGNIIIVMLFFNLFARLTLFCAAWIATAYQPAFPRKYNESDEVLRGRPGVVTVPGHWAAADLDKARIDARQGRALAPLEDRLDDDDTDTWEDAGGSGRPTLIRRRSQVAWRDLPTSEFTNAHETMVIAPVLGDDEETKHR